MRTSLSKAISTLFFAFFILTGFSFAQNVTYSWDIYKTKFTVPKSFKVTQNDTEAFIAGNSDINLSIYPRKKEHLAYVAMKGAVKTWADQSGVSGYTEAEYVKNLNGYWGCWVEGVKDSYPTFLMLAIDPDFPEISLYIWISYNQDKVDVATEILKSFTPN